MSNLHLIVSPSCSGKDVFAQHLIGTGYWDLMVSATTRPPRAGEVNGVNYHFMDEKGFEARAGAGEFLEHACFSGRYYGTPASEVDRILQCKKIPLAIVEPQGAASIRNWCGRNSIPLSLVRIEAPANVLTQRFCSRFSNDIAESRGDIGKVDSIIQYYSDRLASSYCIEQKWASLFSFDRVVPIMTSEAEGALQAKKVTEEVLSNKHACSVPVPCESVMQPLPRDRRLLKEFSARIRRSLELSVMNKDSPEVIALSITSLQNRIELSVGQSLNP